MDVSTIAAASTSLHMAQAQQEASVSVLKKAMSAQETQSAALIQTMQTSNHQLDVLA